MLNKVLFPVIISEYTEQIVGCLSGLAKNGVEEVLLFHVQSVSDVAKGHVSLEQDEAMLVRWRDMLAESGIRADYRIIQGIPWLEIVELADRGDFSFVVIGSHGNTFLDRMFLGSVTENVAHHTRKPVFIFKLKKNMEENSARYCVDVFRKILYVTDFSETAGRSIPYVERMKNNLFQELIILHVQDLRQLKHAAGGKMDEFNRIDTGRLNDLKIHFESLGFGAVEIALRTGFAMTEILAFAKQINASIIVLGKKGRSDVREMLLGGVAETVIHKSEAPVFLIGGKE